jgi:hypothetical protein
MQLVMVSILSLAIPWNAFASAAQAPTFRTGVTDIAVNPEGLDNKRSVGNLCNQTSFCSTKAIRSAPLIWTRVGEKPTRVLLFVLAAAIM